MSYLAVPLIGTAILGDETSQRFFPALTVADFGAAFSLTEAVRVVREILLSGTAETNS
jgi:hypothetical protein